MKVFDLKVKRSLAGLGLYAGEAVPRRGRRSSSMSGNRVKASEPSGTNRYLFNVNSRWDIDGSPRWNTARYINHSCRPNCEAVDRRGRIFIVSKRNIKAGEELTYDYGKDYFEGYLSKGRCRCAKCSEKINELTR